MNPAISGHIGLTSGGDLWEGRRTSVELPAPKLGRSPTAFGALMKRFLPLLALLALIVTGCSLGQPTAATSVTDDGATLNGTVSSNQSGEVLYWFEYGTDTTYGTVTPDRALTFPEGHTASDPGVPVSEPISGLEPSTTYHYRICTSPGAQPGSRGCVQQDETFTTDPAPEQTLVDSAVADFSAGTPGADTYVGATGSGTDGEVVLRPEVGEEFDGNLLPAGWSTSPWTGGDATVSGGTATIDGALLRTDALFGPGRTLEFEGAFSGAEFQHIGLAVDLNNDPAWAIFSTGGGQLPVGFYARTNGPAAENTAIPDISPTEPHRYRIVWTASQVQFFVDGASVATHSTAITGDMRPVGSDFTSGGGATTWHWVRLSPYHAAGTFASRVLDSGQGGSDWTTLQPATATPPGSQLDIETRSGDTGTPDDTWSAWESLGGLGTIVSPDARYLQYRVALSSSDTTQTPVVERVTVSYR
jgi:hypothetical protein